MWDVERCDFVFCKNTEGLREIISFFALNIEEVGVRQSRYASHIQTMRFIGLLTDSITYCESWKAVSWKNVIQDLRICCVESRSALTRISLIVYLEFSVYYRSCRRGIQIQDWFYVLHQTRCCDVFSSIGSGRSKPKVHRCRVHGKQSLLLEVRLYSMSRLGDFDSDNKIDIPFWTARCR